MFINCRIKKDWEGQFSRRTIVRREHGRIRANTGEFAANSREFADCSPTFFFCEHWRTIGEQSANSREHWRSSREFARIRAEFAANWRTVRQKNIFIRRFPTFRRTTVRREQLFAANNNHSTNCAPRTNFWRTIVHQLANDCSPTMKFCFKEQSFAANDCSPRRL